MKIVSLTLSIFSIALFFSCSQNKEVPGRAFISGRYVGLDKQDTIYVRDFARELDWSTPIHLDTVITDSTGAFSFTLELDHPKEIALNSDFEFVQLFAAPGDSIYFISDGDYKTPLDSVRGKGSGKLKIMEATEPLLSFLELVKYDSAEVMPGFEKRMMRYNEITDSVGQNFTKDFYNYFLALKKYKTYYFHRVFPYYIKTYKQVAFPPDSIAIASAADSLKNYASKGLVSARFHDGLFGILLEGARKADSVDATKRLSAYENSVAELRLLPEGNQLLLGKGYLYFLSNGNVEEVRGPFNEYLSEYPNSVYNTTMKKEFAEWEALSKGHQAPEIIATDTTGNEFKLSGLKGKVVYVDIWATWCGPCIAEFPYAKKIKEHYKNNKDIAFLYVSVDTSKDRWLKFLNERPDFNGVHVHDPGNFEAKIAKAYKVQGIPRYMIIDREGKIYSTEAKRPSNGQKLIDQLDKALGA